jgi:glycerol-3-phosphate dehydrogenase
VPDASIDVWKLAWGLARSAEAHGAQVLPYHRVTGLVREGDTVVGAQVLDERHGVERELRARVTLNASGAWAGQVAGMAGCEVRVIPGRGIMVAMNHRLVQHCVNRCTLPGDGDIIVPIRTVCVIGTTDVQAEDPDRLALPADEVQAMLDAGEKLVPGFRQARALRAWVGARPLYQESTEEVTDTHHITRTFALLDHRERDGVDGFLTITGGKLTTFRLMAKAAVDGICERLGVAAACRTDVEKLPGSEDERLYQLGDRLRARERTLHDDQAVCECELVSRSRLVEALAERDDPSLVDIRRALRLGMGPCQGGFCIYRATGLVHGGQHLTAAAANEHLLDFLQERWQGVRPVLYGDQYRQARFDDWVFQGLLDVGHLESAPTGLATTPG